ncbi:hypothetical protein SAMN05660642_01332 [Geodermatophilus siccatus]|uniref:SipW-cognate class signal peptide n=2 Tax=Geodermatophilus siccatus TaxID=1137991 RepID=A0A1G9PRN3_9ACTN|nr:hypothetical protein SAMN05660642_01332 [Geodermatophilus siccatus]
MNPRRSALALALALPASLLLGPAQPAAAFGGHTVTVTGGIVLNDDEGDFDNPSQSGIDFTRKMGLTHLAPSSSIFVSYCHGDEVRGEFTVTATLQANDDVVWQPHLKLYEGASCDTSDLDGELSGQFRTLPPNFHQEARIFVPNSDEGGDWASVRYDVIHDVA